MSDFSIRTTYKPGEGYFGYLPGSDKPAMRWGREFRAMMAEKAAQRKAEEAAAEPFTRAELTQEDIKELAAKYAPDNMTQEEYDAFLDDLIEKGVMEKKDLDYIDYRGDLIPNGQFICVGQLDLSGADSLNNLGDPFKGCICSYAWTGPRGQRPTFLGVSASRPSSSDVLAWAKEMSLWKPHGPASTLLDAENRRNDIYTVLADALDAMQRQRIKDRL